jgi:hypothetical protein
LAHDCNCKFASFGDYVRLQAKKRGTPKPNREDLQNLGQRLAEADMLGFCRGVLDTAHFSPGERLVIDGVRHTEALRAISTISGGQPIKLIYLQATAKVRKSRNAAYDQHETLDRIDAHPVESQTNSEIKHLADLVIDADREIEESFSQIFAWVRTECPELLFVRAK